jgi:hypothetical protein
LTDHVHGTGNVPGDHKDPCVSPHHAYREQCLCNPRRGGLFHICKARPRLDGKYSKRANQPEKKAFQLDQDATRQYGRHESGEKIDAQRPLRFRYLALQTMPRCSKCRLSLNRPTAQNCHHELKMTAKPQSRVGRPQTLVWAVRELTTNRVATRNTQGATVPQERVLQHH